MNTLIKRRTFRFNSKTTANLNHQRKLSRKIPYKSKRRWLMFNFCGIVVALLTFKFVFKNDKHSNMTASFQTIEKPSIDECLNLKSSSKKHDQFSFPSDNPMIVEGFPNTPVISNGFLDPSGPYDSILFKAKSSKLPNGPILSTGSNMLFQQTDIEYRLLEVKGYLNYTSIHNNEGVESDFCIVVNLIEQLNSVSSGEELVCAHETFYGGDRSRITERQGNHKPPFVIFNFGPHGIPLKPNHKLSIASVSKIFTAEGFHPLSDTDTAARDAPSKPVNVSGIGEVSTSLDLLALIFEALIVPVQNENEAPQGLRSIRIPQRDRSLMPMVQSKDAFPLTSYRHVGDHPIHINSIGIFRSVLEYYVEGYTTLKLFVNERKVFSYCPQQHVPGISSARFEETIPFDLEIQPNDIVRVEHTLSSFIPKRYLPKSKKHLPEVFDPVPYDLAIYIFYENGENAPDSFVLVPFEENDFVDANGGLDLNNDGVDDFVEYDSVGTIWKELSSAEGAHDTQHVGFRHLITKKGKFNKKTTSWVWERNAVTKLMEATVTDNVENICFYLKAKEVDHWRFEYCDESKVSHVDYDSPNYNFGDFDGDSHIDRMRIESFGNSNAKKLFFAKGNGKSYDYEKMIGFVEGECVESDRGLESLFLSDKGHHALFYGWKCPIDLSNATMSLNN